MALDLIPKQKYDKPNYSIYNYCRTCRKNHPKHEVWCNNCGKRLADRPKGTNAGWDYKDKRDKTRI